MRSTPLYSLAFFILISFLLFRSDNLFAKLYTSNGRIHQIDGPVEANDVNQKVLKIVLNVGNGGGESPFRSSMSFNLFGNAEILNAKLYFQTVVNDSNFSTATLAQSIPSPGATVTFSGFNANNSASNGDWFYWLVTDAKSTITNGIKIDAEYTGSAGSASTPGFQNGATPVNPVGFRFTSRNYLIGNTVAEQYPTITATAAGISRFDYDGNADIFMEMTSNYANPAESGGTIIFQNHLGPANVFIRPQSGQVNKITAGDPGSGVVFMYFGGVQKITLDGRPGGIDPLNPDDRWSIRNGRTLATVASTVQFKDDASNNSFKFLNIEGEGGIISIETSVVTGGTGNDNITFSNCVIRDLTGGSPTLPFIGINSAGTAGKTNDNITIDSCQFVDIFNPPAGPLYSNISITSNSSTWTITNNHFYQTSNYANLNNNTYAMMYIGAGGGHIITGNFLGGKGVNCSGGSYTITSGNLDLRGIMIDGTVSGPTITINNNTISNIAFTTTITAAFPAFRAIDLNGSANITCGSSGNGNTIGSTSGSGNITITNNGLSGSLGFAAINVNSSGNNSISYNSIGGITLNGTRTAAESEFILNTSTAGTLTVTDNTFGNTSAGNILISSDSRFHGIKNSSTNGITISNNTFQNISHSATTQAMGIIYNAAGPLTATGNTFKNITTSTNINSWMIDHEPSAAATADVSNNTIQDISFTNTGTSARFFGISINQPTSAATCNNNVIGSTTPNNISLAGNTDSHGIYHSNTGSLTCNNNTIQQFNVTNTGTSGIFYGINVLGGVFSATGNTVQDISVASTSGGNVFMGMQINTSVTGHAISKCTIKNAHATTTSGAANINLLGIYVTGASSGGNITKNFISGLTAQTTGNGDIKGIFTSSGAWNVYNNVVLLDNSPYTNNITIEGIIEQESAATINVCHNTVILSGNVSSGNSYSTAYYRTTAGTSTDNVKNNIFQNLRTGGTGGHYAEYAVAGGTYATNFNYLEVAENQSKVGNLGGTDYNFADWKTATTATNDLEGTISLDANGKVTTDPFPGAGTGTNLTATVPDDKMDITRGIASWMGAFEGPDITTSTISPLNYCAGGAIGVSYTVGGGESFNGGNIFTAQLSNSSGDFSSPTNIGTLASTISGTITATIPGGTPNGNGYRIRVVSSSPVVTGSDNMADIDIQQAIPSAPVENSATGITCSGFTANWAASTGAITYFLDVAEDAGFTTFVTGYNNLDVGNITSYNITGLIAGTTYYYRMRAANGCGNSANSGVKTDNTSGTQQTYIVTSAANSGAGTLNQAIADANANCGHDIIIFDLGAGGPFTIGITTALPNLTDNDGVTIDGWNNSGNDGTPNSVAVFDATTATPLNPTYKIILGNNNNIATGLVLASDNNIIKGLVLQDFGDGTPSANDIAITLSGNNNKILGCYIGMDVTGTTRGTKTGDGIVITGANNMVGDGTAAGANLISGLNGSLEGIWINGASATDNIVKGNMIGLQKDGTTKVTGAAQFSGVYINTSAIGNTIGGGSTGEGNVISGSTGVNARGIYLNTSTAGGNTVLGNIIGACADGVTNVASNEQTFGIMISNSPDNIIGGNTTGARNIISGNLTYGIDITGASSIGNIVKGNYIGIDKTGTTFIIGSTQDYGVGILVTAGSNTIGGTSAGEGNVISGNNDGIGGGKGIYLNNSTGGNTVLGNIIGPQADGVTYLVSNVQAYGINIQDSPNNTIGGNTAGARNIISANENYGVFITGAGSTGNVVKGNYIGIDKNGTTFITTSTQDYGVYITSSAASNIIGGSGAGEGNVISGNGMNLGSGYGIFINSSAAEGNSVLGNIIGPEADGINWLTEYQDYGIYISNSPNNTIGGNSAGARNLISANEIYGIYITGVSSTGNSITGNFIGININGNDVISSNSQKFGIYITSSASSNIIGGSNTGEGNLISGNDNWTYNGRGIFINSTVGNNSILGNTIGPLLDGTYNYDNGQNYGIEINNSPNNIIGGNTAGAKNIISANEDYGVYITGASSTGNIVKGNYIGPSSSLANITGSSQNYGVYFISDAANNTIGTTAAGEANEIAFNTINGVYITGASSIGNVISANPVYSNTGKPIELNYGVNQGNNGKTVPVITSATEAGASGTSGSFDEIEIFKNSSGDCNSAMTFVGSVSANVGGFWSIPVALSQGEYVLATARDGSNNTSEFSSCLPVIADRYWVGGNAMWNNPANWSATTGGAGGAGVPDINSNVFIDNNSGTVTISIPSGTWYTKGFSMSGNGAKASIIGQGALLPRP